MGVLLMTARRPGRAGWTGRGGHRGDSGIALPLAALVMVALLSFSAMVVDLGQARAYRRQTQNAADAAALAAVYDLPDFAGTVSSVKDYAAENLGIAAGDWDGCQDPGALPETPDAAAHNNTCISIYPYAEEVRVTMPSRAVPTYFGRFLGRNEIDLTATAQAAATYNVAHRVMPITVTELAGTGHLCLENSGSDQDCENRTTGNFGSLQSPRLETWTTLNESDKDLVNWTLGVDHSIVPYGAGDTRVCDGLTKPVCTTDNVSTNLVANHVRSATGNSTNRLTAGLVEGFDDSTGQHFCGRLQRPNITPENFEDPNPGGCMPDPPTTTSVSGTTINGHHIYAVLTDEAKQSFYPEVWATDTGSGPVLTDGLYASGDLRLECFLQGYTYLPNVDPTIPGVEVLPNCTALGLDITAMMADGHAWPIFAATVTIEPRFGMIPIISPTWGGGASEGVEIVTFLGSFLYDTYETASQVKAIDAWVFSPALVATTNGVPGLDLGVRIGPFVHLSK
jgi:hypothetical protein